MIQTPSALRTEFERYITIGHGGRHWSMTKNLNPINAYAIQLFKELERVLETETNVISREDQTKLKRLLECDPRASLDVE